MKYKKIIISAIVKMFFIVLFITNSVASEVHASSNVYLNKTKATLIKGESVKLKIKGTKKAVKWKSKNKKIATVSKKVIVVAKKQGTAKIVATVSGKKYTCIIKVKNLSKEMKTVSLNIGSSRKLKVLNYNKKLKWSSKNKKWQQFLPMEK